MKLKSFAILLVLCTLGLNAQLYTPSALVQSSSNNNIGIRTASPQAILHISATTGFGGLRVDAASGMGPAPAGEDPPILYSPYIFKGTLSGSDRFLVNAQGKTYIGSAVSSYSAATQNLAVKSNMGVFSKNTEYLLLDYTNTLRGASLVWNNEVSSNERNFNIRFGSNTSPSLFTIKPDGKVGIATTAMNSDHKLYVGGKILCTELTVKLMQDWPDYVFEETYQRRSLEETEAFIKENGHLPDVPSAAEIAKNGVPVGEMQAILLKKIEELTLEVIELKKQVAAGNSSQVK